MLAHDLGEAVRAATGYRPTADAIDDALRRDRAVRIGWRDGQCVYWIDRQPPAGAAA